MINVLCIDDDEAMVNIFSSALNRAEFKVTSSSNGTRGIDLARELKPDIIFLDQILPDILGNDILLKLKENVETNTIPVIIFSAYFNSEAKEEALKRGAVDYVAKFDLEPTKLEDKIKKYLHI